MEDSPVIYAVEGAVALVTLNRPEKRNALNDALVAALKGALRDADAREEVRAVVLTGAGADFCSGADLSALQKISEASVEENLEDARKLLELYALIRSVPVPVGADEDLEEPVGLYVAAFENVGRSAVVLTMRLLYRMDGVNFDAALQAGADVNTIARMTEDCRAGIARFLMRVK